MKEVKAGGASRLASPPSHRMLVEALVVPSAVRVPTQARNDGGSSRECVLRTAGAGTVPPAFAP
jgi:hypothetical protein